MIGQTLGHYRIESRLEGRGLHGMTVGRTRQ